MKLLSWVKEHGSPNDWVKDSTLSWHAGFRGPYQSERLEVEEQGERKRLVEMKVAGIQRNRTMSVKGLEKLGQLKVEKSACLYF